MKIQKIICIGCCLAMVSFAYADTELDRLKDSYENAVSKAVEPLKATYAKELQKLLQRHAQAGRIDDVAKVMTEMKAIGVTAETAVASTPVTVQRSNDQFFVNTTWKTPTGTSFSFTADGKGTRSFGGADQTTFTWRSRSGGMVEATGDASKGGEKHTWFFRFVSESEAYYGSKKEDVVTKLQKQP